MMFGCRAWFVDGKMFAVAWRGNPVLRLAEADRAKACETLGAKPWSPGRGAMKEYVEIPATKLKGNALRLWAARSLRYIRVRLPK
jgi:TfoX/Sxy family transcriptional regulator of competence genes